ncbi:Molybdopterin molybdenumtransferase [Methylobacterium longum]|uniref:molybdopterin-binding protein n=1 Tax=Methylobacterium sp. E-046 TaxID=2836576 RepID=UPI001FB9A532|nr:molybdopterin-binding protein [Methylobacterium sp. E-046]GJE11786.1 Molybdopterin molybdenumtransferase [Methylobacterium longum]
MVAAAAAHDLIVTSGGVSVGEEDHVRAAVEASSGLTFWRLAIKPGRPVALGQVDGTAFFGLPGNPVTA